MCSGAYGARTPLLASRSTSIWAGRCMQADGGLGRASGGQGCHPATSVDTNLEARGTDAERSSVARPPPPPPPLCARDLERPCGCPAPRPCLTDQLIDRPAVAHEYRLFSRPDIKKVRRTSPPGGPPPHMSVQERGRAASFQERGLRLCCRSKVCGSNRDAPTPDWGSVKRPPPPTGDQ